MFSAYYARTAAACVMALAVSLTVTAATAGQRVTAAASCPAASYGARFYAPGSSKTAALTFDDGPGRSTAAILAILTRYRVPATFFNIGVNMPVRPSLHNQPAGNPATVSALPTIIRFFRSRGYRFVRL